MPHYQYSQRSVTPPGYPYSPHYPGLSPYEAPIPFETSALVPYGSPVQSAAPTVVTPAASAAKSGGLSIPKLGDLKGIIDRMGGIDGVVATMGQVQKVMQGIQQFAPMAKLVMGGLLPGGKGKTNSATKLDEFRPKKRSSKNSKSGTRKKKSSSSSRSSLKKKPVKKKTRR
ncbi:hypothetical protein EJP77_11590 [Paenibacillus zeisoli]|uniref:Tyrosine protein kinase n=1 Tax=Paenibacillus zeisoli TaxID=2496267 RepID=A0A433X8N5_9BACL|nr:hypothetical protein [Paenibacillus zeisoli]RUT30477.1 hypothetical protein EJP77_11590 [Paenibacillus zeisoli]